MAGKSKNAYTNAILAVIDEYKMVVKDKKPKTPMVSAKIQPSAHPIRRYLEEAGLSPDIMMKMR